MAILIEAISVIIKLNKIIELYPHGWEAFLKNAPNQTICADQHIVRIGFMSPVDVEAFIKNLESLGFEYVKDDKSQDIAVADQLHGFSIPCGWAEIGNVNIDGNNIKACRAVGDDTGQLITPDNWQYDGSLSQTYTYAPTEQVDKSLKFLRHENGLDVYLNTVTGAEVYLGRTSETPA